MSRKAALRVLVNCRTNGAWADAALNAQIRRDGLAGPDAALCSRIVYGVLQNQLLLDHYIAPGAKRCYICVALFSALAFGLLPWMACFVDSVAAVKIGVVGGVTFTVTTLLFSSIQERLSSGPAA